MCRGDDPLDPGKTLYLVLPDPLCPKGLVSCVESRQAVEWVYPGREVARNEPGLRQLAHDHFERLLQGRVRRQICHTM
jgi:hypothetical protein